MHRGCFQTLMDAWNHRVLSPMYSVFFIIHINLWQGLTFKLGTRRDEQQSPVIKYKNYTARKLSWSWSCSVFQNTLYYTHPSCDGVRGYNAYMMGRSEVSDIGAVTQHQAASDLYRIHWAPSSRWGSMVGNRDCRKRTVDNGEVPN